MCTKEKEVLLFREERAKDPTVCKRKETVGALCVRACACTRARAFVSFVSSGSSQPVKTGSHSKNRDIKNSLFFRMFNLQLLFQTQDFVWTLAKAVLGLRHWHHHWTLGKWMECDQ